MTHFDELCKRLDSKHEPPPGPRGWIQWKGTDICMDVYCACGESSHVDAEFVYFVRCPHCKAVYWVSPHVVLEPVEYSGDDVVEAE